MELALYSKNLELTASLRDYVQSRLDKLDRFLSAPLPTAQVVLSVQRDRQLVEVTFPYEGFLIRAEDSESSMYAAIDLVLSKLERQVEKCRTRLQRKPRHHETGHAAPAAGPAEVPDESEQPVRIKTFPLKPMTVDEAVLQMNLLAHDFFVFREAGSLEVQVVYRRRAGGYGLIVAR